MADTAIVLQARMGSSRLPGKSLARIAGASLLAHCIERLGAESGLPVIVATTTSPLDDAIQEEAGRMGAAVVRGPEDDVLSRYVLAADRFDLVHLVRATADNPVVDLGAPVRTLNLLRRSGADHVTEHGLPVGTAVEAVSVAALRRAAQLTDAPYDREHVTPYLRRGPGMRAVVLRAPTMLTNPRLRLTVDTADDLALVRRIYARLGARTSPAPLTDIMTIAEQLSADQLQQTGAVAR
jgi:spore coat polysaccharide biosynthesis protein SpsF